MLSSFFLRPGTARKIAGNSCEWIKQLYGGERSEIIRTRAQEKTEESRATIHALLGGDRRRRSLRGVLSAIRLS
jgi:hypothetical protein